MGDINYILVCRTLISEQSSVDAQVTQRVPLRNFALSQQLFIGFGRIWAKLNKRKAKHGQVKQRSS